MSLGNWGLILQLYKLLGGPRSFVRTSRLNLTSRGVYRFFQPFCSST